MVRTLLLILRNALKEMSDSSLIWYLIHFVEISQIAGGERSDITGHQS